MKEWLVVMLYVSMDTRSQLVSFMDYLVKETEFSSRIVLLLELGKSIQTRREHIKDIEKNEKE